MFSATLSDFKKINDPPLSMKVYEISSFTNLSQSFIRLEITNFSIFKPVVPFFLFKF